MTYLDDTEERDPLRGWADPTRQLHRNAAARPHSRDPGCACGYPQGLAPANATPVTAVRKPTHAVARYSVRADSVECTCGQTVTPAAAFTAHRTGKHRGRPPKAPSPTSVPLPDVH